MIIGFPSKKIGSLFGVPIYFEIAHVFVIFSIMSWVLNSPEQNTLTELETYLTTLIVTALTLISLLAHEFSHVRAGQLFGHKTEEVRMVLLGAVANMASTGQTAWQSFVIAIAGPAMSFILYFLFGVLSYTINNSVILASVSMLGTINLILAIFNLIPAYPMDGGRILVSIFWALTRSFVFAMKAGATIGIFIAGVGIYLTFTSGGLILGLISGLIIFINVGILISSNDRILKMLGYKTLSETTNI